MNHTSALKDRKKKTSSFLVCIEMRRYITNMSEGGNISNNMLKY